MRYNLLICGCLALISCGHKKNINKNNDKDTALSRQNEINVAITDTSTIDFIYDLPITLGKLKDEAWKNIDSTQKITDFDFCSFAPVDEKGKANEVELSYKKNRISIIRSQNNDYVLHTFEVIQVNDRFRVLFIRSGQTDKGFSTYVYPNHPGFILVDSDKKKCLHFGNENGRQSIIELNEKLAGVKQIVFKKDTSKYNQSIVYKDNRISYFEDCSIDLKLTKNSTIAELYSVLNEIGKSNNCEKAYPSEDVMTCKVPIWQYGGVFSFSKKLGGARVDYAN